MPEEVSYITAQAPDPPYEGIVGICALSIRKTDRIMRVLLDDGRAIDVDVSRLTDIPARKGDRVGIAAKEIQTGFYIAVYCRNLETQREFFFFQPSGGCYIATAVFGQNSNEVRHLRNFRDQVLTKSRLGGIFTEVYYRVSPRLVKLSAIRISTPFVRRTLHLLLILLRKCKFLNIKVSR